MPFSDRHPSQLPACLPPSPHCIFWRGELRPEHLSVWKLFWWEQPFWLKMLGWLTKTSLLDPCGQQTVKRDTIHRVCPAFWCITIWACTEDFPGQLTMQWCSAGTASSPVLHALCITLWCLLFLLNLSSSLCCRDTKLTAAYSRSAENTNSKHTAIQMSMAFT